jgi:hypothetical protein
MSSFHLPVFILLFIPSKDIDEEKYYDLFLGVKVGSSG